MKVADKSERDSVWDVERGCVRVKKRERERERERNTIVFQVQVL